MTVQVVWVALNEISRRRNTLDTFDYPMPSRDDSPGGVGCILNEIFPRGGIIHTTRYCCELRQGDRSSGECLHEDYK
jgi:hypothetical protein